MRKIFLLLLFIGMLFASVNAGVKFDFGDKSFSLFERIVAEGTQVQEKPAIFFSSPYEDLMFVFKTNIGDSVGNKLNNGIIKKLKIITSKIEVENTESIKSNIEDLAPIEILITKNDILIDSVNVKVNQPVIWKNEQRSLQALIYGMREISGMRSGFIEPGESFTWEFSEPGEYVYVDSVVIGRTGKIVVNP